jgi:hypothetical protein
MKKIYFVVQRKKYGTGYLRGVQIQRALRHTGIKSSIVLTRDVHRCKNALLIFVKILTPNVAIQAHSQGNRIIWDILDGYDDNLIQQIASSVALDGLITSTAASEPALACLNPKEKALIYHHIDPRLINKIKGKPKSSNFSICYIGNIPAEINGKNFTEAFPDVKGIEVDTKHAKRCDWMHSAAPFRCHFAVRLDKRECLMKPLAKVGVAAAYDANIIVNRSNAAVELLGSDYPYLCDDTIDDALRTIERARSDFGNSTWLAGLERMAKLRDKLSIEKNVVEYCSFLSRFN